MAVNQRPQWTAVEIAAHAMQATSLSELTLPEVKRMAAHIIGGERKATDSKPAAEPNLRAIPQDEFERGWTEYQKFVD